MSAANPLLSNITPGVESNVFQQSNLTQLYEDEYDDIQQIEDFVASTFDSDSWVKGHLFIYLALAKPLLGYQQ